MKLFFERISSFLYEWGIDATENNFVEVFGHEGHGMEYCLYILIGISLLFPLIFYFFIAKDVNNATPKNYLLMMLMGYIVLAAVNYLVIATIFGNELLSSTNLFWITILDIVYYMLLFELWSWVFKGMSNASNICLYSILFNKK